MKNLILSAAVMFVLTISAAAAATEPSNAKVVKTFNEVFKAAHDVKWTTTGNYYMAFFTVDGIKIRAILDAKGNLVQTIRYYTENNLPANVLYHVKHDFPGKEVWGVTEVTNNNGVNYRIVLRDNKSYIHINANSLGESEIAKKYKRGDK
ncbi:MAG: hypothetical protein QM640_05555 [Niabella sp.]